MVDSGTFISVDVQGSLIEDFIHEHQIPRTPFDASLHSTIFWSSSSIVGFKSSPQEYLGQADDITVLWHGNIPRLVLLLNAPSLVIRHQQIAKQYSAQSRYKEFIPHITLSYDVGNFDWWNLPPIMGQIRLKNEFAVPGNIRKRTSQWNKKHLEIA